MLRLNTWPVCTTALAVCLQACTTSGTSARAVVDSVVLTRKVDLCISSPCPTTVVTLRRGQVSNRSLELIDARAAAAGFYDMPRDLPGSARFCHFAISDALMATLAIYRRDREWSVRGYHHCLGDSTWTELSPSPPEKTRLVALEALVDSIAGTPRVP